jgi:hypothetical protein
MTESELRQKLEEIDDRLRKIHAKLYGTRAFFPHEDLRELAEKADILEDEKRRIQGHLKAHA